MPTFGLRVGQAVRSLLHSHHPQSPGCCLQPNTWRNNLLQGPQEEWRQMAAQPGLTLKSAVPRSHPCLCGERAGARVPQRGWGGTERALKLSPVSCSPSRLQELYYEIVHVLRLMLEELPQKNESRSSEKMEEQ